MKKWAWPAGLLAAAFTALAVWGQYSLGGGDLIYGLTLPLIGLGAGLRWLSLSGPAGNGLAVLLYVTLSILPLAYLIRARRKDRSTSVWLPVAMSVYLFFLLFFLANPSMVKTLFHPLGDGSPEALGVKQAMLCMFLYLMLVACWVLSILRDTGRLPLQIRRLLRVTGASLILSVFYINVASLKSSLLSLPWPGSDPLTMAMTLPGMPVEVPTCDALMAVLRFLLGSAPALLLFSALPMAENLVNGLEKGLFSQENQARAAAVAARCKLAILVSVIGMLFLNGLQLLLARFLANVSVSGQIPIETLLLSLAMLLLSKYLEKSCEVYRENQMMI